ncbi:MAG: sulfurtransferase [Burkholderiales bacterium]
MPAALISTDQLAQHLSDPAWVVVDCRHNLVDADAGERAYRSAHIPGAHFLHLDRDLSGAKTGRNGRHPLPGAKTLADRLGALGIDSNATVVAYDDQGGMFAARLWWLLRWLGHENVALLDGGITKWQAEMRAVDAHIPQPRAKIFLPAKGLQHVTVDYVSQHLHQPDMCLIDARAPDRFAGQNETLDPLAGHIPGAVNRFFKGNLNADGSFKNADVLKKEFLILLGNNSPQQVVHQCGSGVTSCLNLFAMELAALHGSKLYAGSWSEWCADSARPIKRGMDGEMHRDNN